MSKKKNSSSFVENLRSGKSLDENHESVHVENHHSCYKASPCSKERDPTSCPAKLAALDKSTLSVTSSTAVRTSTVQSSMET